MPTLPELHFVLKKRQNRKKKKKKKPIKEGKTYFLTTKLLIQPVNAYKRFCGHLQSVVELTDLLLN